MIGILKLFDRLTKVSELLQLKLEDASLDEIAELALRAIGPKASAKKAIDG